MSTDPSSNELAVVPDSAEAQSDVRPEDGLLHQLLGDEGIRSYASTALGDVPVGAAVLSMSSARPDGFVDSDVLLVDAVARVLAPHVRRLRSTA